MTMEQSQAKQEKVEGGKRVFISAEAIRSKAQKTPEEEAYLRAYDKSQAERQQYEARVREKTRADIASVRENIDNAKTQPPHITEHPVQTFRAADIEAAVAAKKGEEEKKAAEGKLKRRIKMLGQFFRSSR